MAIWLVVVALFVDDSATGEVLGNDGIPVEIVLV